MPGVYRRSVTPKSVRPDQFWQKILPKLAPRTTFAAKIGPAGPVLAAKTGPPLPILVPPVKYKSGQFIVIAS